ncbi:adhesin, partial [Lactobacillus gasseri]|nr:adhesin [Lactobacillus gasseri]
MSVVVKYIDLDNNSAELASSETLNGKVGERVNYHTAEEVQKLIAAGYVLVNNPFDLNNEVHFFNETSQEYKLTFKHAQEEVTAKNLKYDCQLGDVQLKGKQVVHYTGLEKNIADNIVEVTFNRKIIYDKVTKQKVSLSAWQPEKYYLPLIATPAVLDYTPDKTVIGGEAVTVQKPKHEYVVTYLPNKKNARRQKAEIKFIDVDNNNQELASSGELKGKPGKEISYSTTETLKELSDKGYEVINNDFDSKDQKPVFGNSRDYIQTFIIALRHKKQAVNSDHPSSEIDHRLYEKEVHRKITFSGLSGQKLDDIVQTAVLKRSLTMDMVTKKIIQGEYTSQWQSTETYPSVAVPVVAGYHTKTKEVVACPVVEEDLSEDIKYYANGYLIPVDANHNKLSEIDKKQLITNSINPTKAIFPNLELENIVLKPIK